MKLSKEEKEYLWKKLEYNKKKKSIETKNELYHLLNDEKLEFTDKEFEKIIKSLELTFRKRLIGDKADLNNDLFKSIKAKIPSDMIVIKSGRIDRKPTKSSTKSEIISYLKRKNIEYNEKSTKAELLGLFENMNIKTFDGFNKQK